jgi:hypothetical protein
MAHLNHESPFQSWVLTPLELLQGSILSLLQKQVVQNQIATLAIGKINLEPDFADPVAFAQREAFLRGQIAALQYLIDFSNSSEAQLQAGAQSEESTSLQSPLFPQE